MNNTLENVVRVYDKNGNILAIFDGNSEGLQEEEMRNLMISPRVHLETNGESTLSFQMLANSEKWQQINNPENIFELNGRQYTALNNGAYEYVGEGSAQIVNVTLVETWYLLDKKFVQAYNCGIYCYAKAKFKSFTTDGAIFTISAAGCSNPAKTITSAMAWEQVKLWTAKNEDGQELIYGILQTDDDKPTNWEDPPAGVVISNISFSGNTATISIKPRATTTTVLSFSYSGNKYKLEKEPYPAKIEKVYVNTTIKENAKNDEGKDVIRYTTSNKDAPYTYSNGTVSLNYKKVSEDETINTVFIEYAFSDLGEISSGATCTFAYGAEVVDEHTFAILPKSNSKYKLTIDGVQYNDSQVRDARGVIMPRGSGGYAMWAALKNSGWTLGICDVIAKGFDASNDYGCFNVETDMKDVLYIAQYIQELYGGILDFDSKNKIVNYRAENGEDYDSYNDGFNTWTGYEFREGKNLLDKPQITVDNEIITRAFVLGYGNLNFKDVNGNKSYIDDFSFTNKIYEGYIEQPLIYDTRDDGGKKQLLYWGKRELAKKCKPRFTISLNATDIRIVPGYEHEVFDLNNIVRAYFIDSKTGEETFVEKRITLWEYNAFALWDCSIEMGDKTQNLSEVFKLIYRKTQSVPQSNASGKISADEVVIEIPKYSDFDIDGWSYGYSGNGGYGGGYGGGGMYSMEEYIEIIARKTTENTDAISGLIIEATELYAQTEVFASFQKTTENMVSDTYAGLLTYADSEISKVSLVVEGHYTEYTNWKKDDYDIFKTTTKADLELQQTELGAHADLLVILNHEVMDADGTLKKQISAFADFKAEVTRDYAKVSMLSNYTTKSYVDGELNTVKDSIASVIAYADGKFATVQSLASYATKNYVTGAISTSEASIKQYARENFAGISIVAKVNNLGSYIGMNSNYLTLFANTAHTGASIRVYASGTIEMGGSVNIYGNFYIRATNTTVYIKGFTVVWKSARDGNGQLFYYLGHN